MKNILILMLVLCGSCTVMAADREKENRVAIIISSYEDNNNPNLTYDLEELAQAYLVFKDNGIALDIISPKGGAVPVKSNKDELDYIQRFKYQTNALNQLGNTIASQDADPARYAGVIVIGGDGAMMDLPNHKATNNFISYFANKGLPVAAVCHGPAALVNIKLEDGRYFIAGKKLVSFTNREEQAFSGDTLKLFPLSLEDKLKDHQAAFIDTAPMLPGIAVDGNLITAQNPGAVAKAAELFVTQLGERLKPRKAYKDEATLALIARARNQGSYLIDLALSAEPELYDVNYLALYGFYSFSLADSEQDRLKEMELMETIAKHFSHPMYLASMLKAQQQMGFNEKARHTLARIKTEYPNDKVVAELEALVN